MKCYNAGGSDDKSYTVGLTIILVALILGLAAGMFFFVIPWYRKSEAEKAKAKAKHDREEERMGRIKDAGASITTKYSNREGGHKEKELTLLEKEMAYEAERERRRGELADMSDTPSEDEEKDINKRLKGKSRADRKRMLKEIETQKQVEIHMHYKMER